MTIATNSLHSTKAALHTITTCTAVLTISTAPCHALRGPVVELASPDAHWLLADFQIAPTRWAGLRCRVIVGLLYGFFRMVCGLKANSLVSTDENLNKAGFHRHGRRTSEWGLLKSEWWRRG